MPKKEGITGGEILRATWKIISIGISIILLLFFALFIFSITSSFMPVVGKGNIAVIPIEGMIKTDESFMPGIKSQAIVKLVEQAEKNDEIKAIILEINSPGGTPVATDEIANAIKEANKTTIAVIRETGASGAYWIATAADRIYANRMSITGSIGVQASRLEIPGLLADYNVTYRRLVAGRLKDAGSRYREMTDEEEQLYQTMLDKLHKEFIKAVAENRNLPEETVNRLATGFVYLGAEAKELGLVDELGGKKEAIKYIEETLNITGKPVEYKEHKTIFSSLSGMTAEGFYNIGKGIGSVFAAETEVSFT
ncbi:signal peptide peptidase SppA [Candidatus Woesearchaeota archaeon]|nr:signal peptide peptidase SppA [Candidatus Woesearchaeota archaeon]MBW3016287.1 signal peptide peptidase SppA [Candidatus Woesearchaeota archaeon]